MMTRSKGSASRVAKLLWPAVVAVAALMLAQLALMMPRTEPTAQAQTSRRQRPAEATETQQTNATVFFGTSADNIIRTLNPTTCATTNFSTLPRADVTVLEVAAENVADLASNTGRVVAVASDVTGLNEFIYVIQPNGTATQLSPVTGSFLAGATFDFQNSPNFYYTEDDPATFDRRIRMVTNLATGATTTILSVPFSSPFAPFLLAVRPSTGDLYFLDLNEPADLYVLPRTSTGTSGTPTYAATATKVLTIPHTGAGLDPDAASVGLAFDRPGENLYVIFDDGTVQKLAPVTGSRNYTASGAPATGAGNPFGIAVTQDNTILVSNNDAGIVRFNTTPASAGSCTTGITNPTGIAARRTLALPCTDNVGPVVTVTSPANASTATTQTITVTGTASDATTGANGISSVTINGQAATLTGTTTGSGTATFTGSVTLTEGANTITVVARDTCSGVTTTTVTVTRNTSGDVTPPVAPTVTSPANNATIAANPNITVTGTVADANGNGICRVEVFVNNATTPVVATLTGGVGVNPANFSAPVTLVAGANTIRVIAVDCSVNANRSVASTTSVTFVPCAFNEPTVPAPLTTTCANQTASSAAIQAFLNQATATTTCGAPVTVTARTPAGPITPQTTFSPGTTQVTFTFTGTGEAASVPPITRTSSITIVSNLTLTPPANLNVVCNVQGGIAATDPQLTAFFNAVQATSSCGTPTVSISGLIGGTAVNLTTPANRAGVNFPIGNTSVTFTATDPAGGTASRTVVVGVAVAPPVITTGGTTGVVDTVVSCLTGGAVLSQIPLTATVACGTAPTVTALFQGTPITSTRVLALGANPVRIQAVGAGGTVFRDITVNLLFRATGSGNTLTVNVANNTYTFVANDGTTYTGSATILRNPTSMRFRNARPAGTPQHTIDVFVDGVRGTAKAILFDPTKNRSFVINSTFTGCP